MSRFSNLSQEISDLTDVELRSSLRSHNISVGPLTDSTRKVYKMRLQKLQDNSTCDSPIDDGDCDSDQFNDLPGLSSTMNSTRPSAGYVSTLRPYGVSARPTIHNYKEVVVTPPKQSYQYMGWIVRLFFVAVFILTLLYLLMEDNKQYVSD